MSTQRIAGPRTGWIAVGLLIGLAAVGTACGTVAPEPQTKVLVGTSMDEVRQALGQPSRVLRARHSAGPTWIYDMKDGPKLKAYELDFDSTGKVEWIGIHDYITG
jgi:hypothetical protein